MPRIHYPSVCLIVIAITFGPYLPARAAAGSAPAQEPAPAQGPAHGSVLPQGFVPAQERAPESLVTRPTKIDPVAVPLYVGFAVLQGLDFHSTRMALDRGAREGNPVMGKVANNEFAFMAVKAGTATGVVWLAEKVRRRNRVAGLVLMGALNSTYGLVVAHNYRTARGPMPRGQ